MEGDDKVVMDNQRTPKQIKSRTDRKIDKIHRSTNLLKNERWVTTRIKENKLSHNKTERTKTIKKIVFEQNIKIIN